MDDTRSLPVMSCAALIGLAIAVAPARSEELTGRVVAVADGDTVTVLDAGHVQHRIRIAGIDAPERGQQGAQRSKESLAALVYEQPVRVAWTARDGAGRILGKILVSPPDAPCRGAPDCPMTLDAGLAQVASGRARLLPHPVDQPSLEDRERYEAAERQARDRKAGLWRDPTVVPPWEWRAGRRK